MQVNFLGTGGYFANDRRQTACLFVPELDLVFDAGSALYRISNHLRGTRLRIFLTHAHLDHIVGLPTLLVPLLTGKLKQVSIHGTRETLNAIRQNLFAEPVFPVQLAVEWIEIPEQGDMDLGDGVTLRWQRLPSHPGGSLAFRIDQKSGAKRCSVAYVTDTCVDGTYSELIHGAELLIHECYFRDTNAEMAKRTGHSFSSEVARLAVETQVGRLILVHVDPLCHLVDPIGLPEMQRIFPATELAEDGLQVELELK